jgi:hypothetical protein
MIYKYWMLEAIRKNLSSGNYIITRHAQRRCDSRKISIEEIKWVIAHGEIIESYPHDKPYPSCLIMGYVREEEPLYILCALSHRVHIITVHWLDPTKWLDPKTRREKRP